MGPRDRVAPSQGCGEEAAYLGLGPQGMPPHYPGLLPLFSWPEEGLAQTCTGSMFSPLPTPAAHQVPLKPPHSRFLSHYAESAKVCSAQPEHHLHQALHGSGTGRWEKDLLWEAGPVLRVPRQKAPLVTGHPEKQGVTPCLHHTQTLMSWYCQPPMSTLSHTRTVAPGEV